MCGICGIVYSDRSVNPSRLQLLTMRDSIAHRGPDDAGDFISPGIALGSRRLSILDLSPRGHMPMSTIDRRFTITYNGEIYNYRDLRTLAKSKGCYFRSNTDTEVVLQLYALEGSSMLDRLNGMFAFAIWDAVDRTLFLARDHVGIKPLYYAWHENALFFASEEKALFAGGVPCQFDNSAWEELLCFRYVAGEGTPFVGVRRLLPGHYLIWKDGRTETRRWWHLGEKAQALRLSTGSVPTSWFRETFDNSIDLQRISDVPVGVLLSGGLDSSSVASSLAIHAGSGVASFTVRFKETFYDEGPLAKQVADRWKLEYHELMVAQDNIIPLLHAASRLNDEPLAHGNDLYLLAIARYAKPRVTVLLSGEGSDEGLGGYVRYQPLRYPRLLNIARPVFPRVPALERLNGRMRKLSRFLSMGSLDQFVLFNACDVLPDDLGRLGIRVTRSFPYRERMLLEAREVYPNDHLRQAMYLDQHTFMGSLLDRNDRMTMGASIECRVPFLDRRLVEGLAALPTSTLVHGWRTKHLLRTAVGPRLPRDLLQHRKWGFGVPWAQYFREEPSLRDHLLGLHTMEPMGEGVPRADRMRQLVLDYIRGDNQYEPLVKQLFMISIWFQSVFRSSHAKKFQGLPTTPNTSL